MKNNINDINETLFIIERLTNVTCDLSSRRDTLPAACDVVVKDATVDLLTTISEQLKVLKELLNEK